MKLYTAKIDSATVKPIVADDMILTKDLPTAAGSRMLDGYMSLFEAEALTRLQNAGYSLCGKADVGEFAFDLMGETSYNGACVKDGALVCASAEIVGSGDALAALTLDVNGSVRRAAAQSGLISLKPTYGTVSRFGTIPVACSGETVSLLASSTETCRTLLSVIAGHDDKDGTSLPEELCRKVTEDGTPVRRVAVLSSMTQGISPEISAKMDAAIALFRENGVEVCDVADEVIDASRIAWNTLMCAELCNNVSRYDGVKYGYRAEQFTGIDELYTNSRTEAFGELLKTAILFGSETLSTENYQKVYDKALRVRRVVKEAFDAIFADYDAVLLPAVSTASYTEAEIRTNPARVFEENFYTAPASITGLPAVVAGGVQLMGRAFSEQALLSLAALFEKEGN